MRNSVALPPATCQFLISVRDVYEAAIAAAAGPDVIDFKEPADGPLAAVNPSVWEAAAKRFPEQTLSAALGETESAIVLAAQVPTVFRFAKVGPSGLRTPEQLRQVWNSLALSPQVELVPVAYADHDEARCVSVEEVLTSVIATRRRRLLVDTFCKDGRTLFDHLSVERLRAVLDRARAAGVWVAFAGSVRLADVIAIRSRGVLPDCWGVRGDVCQPSLGPGRRREGELDADRIATWCETLRLVTKHRH